MRIKNINARPLAIGRVIEVSWDNPDDFEEIAVHRRMDGFGVDPDHEYSTEIYRGTENTIYDYHLKENAVEKLNDLPKLDETDNFDDWLDEETTYYYTIYIIDEEGEYQTLRSNTVYATTTARYNMDEYLYDKLPYIYHKEDETGDLKGYLKIIGEQLDYLRSKMNIHRQNLNPRTAEPDILDIMAEMLGWDFLDKELSLNEKRMLIGSIPELYRLAGTKKGITAVVKLFSGYPLSTEIEEGEETIMRTVYIGSENAVMRHTERTIPDFDELDPEEVDTADDPFYYLMNFSEEDAIDFDKFTVYVYPDEDINQEERDFIKERLTRVVDEFIPLGAKYSISIN